LKRLRWLIDSTVAPQHNLGLISAPDIHNTSSYTEARLGEKRLRGAAKVAALRAFSAPSSVSI